MPKKNKLTNIEQIHGQLPKQSTPKRACADKEIGSIDDIFGSKVFSSYQQNSLEEYENFLRTLDTMELRAEAGRIGMIPSSNEVQLKRNLIERFKEGQIPSSPLRPGKQLNNSIPIELRNLMGNQ